MLIILRPKSSKFLDFYLNFKIISQIKLYKLIFNRFSLLQLRCYRTGSNFKREFFIIGRGSLASSPNDIFTGDRTQVSLVEPVPSPQNRSTSTQPSRTEPNQPRTSADIIPARGWIRNENGDVILVSYDAVNSKSIICIQGAYNAPLAWV